MSGEFRDYEEVDLPGVLALWRECFPEVPADADFLAAIATKPFGPNPPLNLTRCCRREEASASVQL